MNLHHSSDVTIFTPSMLSSSWHVDAVFFDLLHQHDAPAATVYVVETSVTDYTLYNSMNIILIEKIRK
jgi:hypothetical protein